MLNEKKEIIPRILRDMNDGVLVLDSQGIILYLNDRGRALLGEEKDPTSLKYSAASFVKDTEGKNDAFHQFILDAVYDKEHIHSGEVTYTAADQKVRCLDLKTSFLFNEDGTERIGIVMVFSDVTKLAQLNRQRRESSIVFSVLMICVCIYLFLWSLLRYLEVEPPGWVMSRMIEAISIIMFIIILKTTSFSIHDIGLRVTNAKATFIPDILIAAGGMFLLVGGKFLLLRIAPGFFPEGAPFWDWSVGTFASVIYPFTVILQEFLARGVMQENLKRIFSGKYAGVMSIVVSSLIFGVLHIAYGLPFMLAAVLLLGVLGVFYQKQGNIWGALYHPLCSWPDSYFFTLSDLKQLK